jgi:ATP-dependent protease HslVU (ClpYQ) ATPase subunit
LLIIILILMLLLALCACTAKPSDLLAELQGRLPIRVTLKGLAEEDLYRILTEPTTNLIRQQVELLKVEDVDLQFTDCAIREIAKSAFLVRFFCPVFTTVALLLLFVMFYCVILLLICQPMR